MAKTMNSRERVLTALNHAEPDRVPIGFVEGNIDIDRRLKAHFGLAENDKDGLYQALNMDVRRIIPPYTGPRLHEEVPGRCVDPMWGIRTRWVEHESGGYWDYCDFPLKDQPLEVVEKWPMPDPDDFDYDALFAQCRRHQDYFRVFGSPGFGDLMNGTGMVCGMEQVYMGVAIQDPAVMCYFDRRIESMQGQLERVLDKAQGLIDMVWIGEDLGTQQGPLISLDMFRETIRPRHQKLIDIAKAHNIPVMIHCCGSSSWAFDDFVEMGITVVDTLQPEAAKMAPQYLKENYGDKLSFHGCISTAGPLAYGTPQDVIKNVRETLDIMLPGGGYLLAPTHLIQDNTPTENVLAMYQAANSYY